MDAKLKKVIEKIHEMRSNANQSRLNYKERRMFSDALQEAVREEALLELLDEVDKILND